MRGTAYVWFSRDLVAVGTVRGRACPSRRPAGAPVSRGAMVCSRDVMTEPRDG